MKLHSVGNYVRRTGLVLTFGLFAVAITYAQGGKGTIRAHVVDSSGGVLQGTQVTVEERNITASTDASGDVFIRDLESGHYSLTFSYVGFTSVTKSVEVQLGQLTTVEIQLQVLSQNQEVLGHRRTRRRRSRSRQS